MKIQKRKWVSLLVCLLVAVAGGAINNWLTQPTHANSFGAPTVSVIATGLNNPRGLNFGSDGGLYIAEAGSGGSGPCGPGPEGDRCYGESGSVTRIDPQTHAATRVASELPSLATPDGSFATGIHDISFGGLGNG